MAVAYDAFSESHTGTTGSASQASFSWTHTPVGTPRGIIVFVINLDSATGITQGVTYGGVDLTQSSLVAADTAGEAGRCSCWFLGSGVPTGAQTITVTRTNNTNVMYAVAATVTAGGDTELYEAGGVVLQEDGTLAVQSVTDGSPATGASVRFAAGMSGLASPPPVGTGSTSLASIDLGAQGAAFCRETTAGNGARNVGFSSATSDDRAIVHVAVRQAVTPTQTSVAQVSLASAGTPTTQTSHKLHIRAQLGTVASATMRMALYEGTTNRSGDLESSSLTGSLAEYVLPISDAAAGAITNYSNLSVKFWGYSAAGATGTVQVADLWLETPVSSGVPVAGNDSVLLSEGASVVQITATRLDAISTSEGLTVLSVTTPAADSQTFTEGAASLSDAVATSDSATLSEQTTQTATATSDDAALGEQSSAAATLATSDAGTETEQQSAIALSGPSDAGSLTDTSSLQAQADKAANDAGAVGETSSASATLSRADNFSLLDLTLSLDASAAASDSSSITDTAAPVQSVTLFTASDSWTVSDVVTSLLSTDAKSASDNQSMADTVAGISAQLTAADLASLLEASAVNASLLTGDSLSASELSSLASVLLLTGNDSAALGEQRSISTTLSTNDSASISDVVLSLSEQAQKIASDSFAFNESSDVAQIIAITRTDEFTLTAEVAGVVEVLTAPYIHHHVPLSGIVQELTLGGTVVVLTGGGKIIDAVTAGTVLDHTADASVD